jgi:hypothetical protein
MNPSKSNINNFHEKGSASMAPFVALTVIDREMNAASSGRALAFLKAPKSSEIMWLRLALKFRLLSLTDMS